MENSLRISDLLAKKIKGNITVAEQKELDGWVSESDKNLAVYNNATDRKQQLSKLETYNSFDKEAAWNSIEKELFAPKVISLFSRNFMKYAAAITILLMVTASAALFFQNQNSQPKLAMLDESIKPGVQKATLVLSNGMSHTLDHGKSESVFDERDVQISDNNSSLSYVAVNNSPDNSFKAATYNELITPKGGGYQLQLADGSTVWLNADSKLTFPVAFTDSTRQLFLEGEAYFEVAHNGAPFIVSSGDMDVRVMGTSFNVSAYADDEAKKTTLVEGKVRVDLREGKQLLQEFLMPNTQAVIGEDEAEIAVLDVDASQYNSWVDGKLEFNNETLDHVLKKLARWYDFDYEFSNQSAKDFHFTGRLDNQEKISTILKMLEMTTNVKFKAQDNKIVVQ